MYYRYSSTLLTLLFCLSSAPNTFASRFERYETGGRDPAAPGGPYRAHIGIGPPNPAPEFVDVFGTVNARDCNWNMMALMRAEFQNSGLLLPPPYWVPRSPWYVELKEFLGPGASSGGVLPAYGLPKTWISPIGPATYWLDHDATFFDFHYAFKTLMSEYFNPPTYDSRNMDGDGKIRGGFQIYEDLSLDAAGENNNLAIFVYNATSDFNEMIDISAGCVRPGARGRDRVLNLLLRFGFFDKSCADNEPSSDSSVTSSTASDGGSCSPSMLPKQMAQVLFGLHKIGTSIALWCSGLIVDVSISDVL
ncbi:MAG: hypothetical protein M1812_007448 [Candelaria pacifica]|nr:MAG: hypothetical protein M1812_007448 [Candelaria pacifica]